MTSNQRLRQHQLLLSAFRQSFQKSKGGEVADGDGVHGQWVVVASKSAASRSASFLSKA